MPSIYKALRRDRKKRKDRYGMRIDNRNIFQIENVKKKRDLEIKRQREEKESMLDENI
jgi:hypothetical protein